MSEFAAGSAQRWFRTYCLRLRLHMWGRCVSGVAVALLVLLATQPSPLSFPVFFALTLLSLASCALGSWLLYRPARCLRELYRTDPSLAEQLHTALELDQSVDASPTQQFLQARFNQELAQRLERQVHALPSWRRLAGVAASLMLVVWIGGWWLPQQGAGERRPDPALLQIPHSYRVLYPSYLKRDSDVYSALPEQLRLPDGSRLEIYLEETLPAEDASVFRSIQGDETPLQWVAQQQRVRAALTPRETGTLFLAWRQQSVAIDVIPDQAPEVMVLWPLDKYIFDLSRLTIELSASDDHGLRQVLLYYRNENDGAVTREIIQSFEGDFASYEESYQWELSATPLRAGDNVTAWIEVHDTDTFSGPNVTRSEEFVFEVRSQQEFHEYILGLFRKTDGQLRELLSFLDRKLIPETTAQEDEMQELLEFLREEAAYDRLLSDGLRGFIGDLRYQLRYYQRMREQLEAPPS